MKHTLNRREAALSIGLLAAGGFAQAQEKPAVRILVGFAPGGSADILARLLAEKLRPVLGQNVIVENKPGAAGRLALGDLKRAAPDGLTLCLVGGAALVALPWVFKNVGYDPFKDFTPVAKDNAIRFGLGAIKGVGEMAARAIVAEREKAGPFKDFGDFVGRMGEADLNARTLDCLARAGAFDFTGENRRHLVDSIESVRRHFSSERKERESGQGNLFDLLGAEDAGAARPSDLILRKSEPMPKLEMLNNEKQLLGFYLSGHPLADYHGLDEAVATFATTPDRIELDRKERHTVRICGILGNLEKKISKKDNRPWCLFTVSSRNVAVPVSMFSEAFDAALALRDGDQPLLADGAHVMVDARLSYREERGEWNISAHGLHPLRGAPALIKKILFALKPGPEAGPFMEKLVAHTRKVDGPTIVQVGFLQPDGRVLVAEAARGMTTRFDPATYGALARDPACATRATRRAEPSPLRRMAWCCSSC